MLTCHKTISTPQFPLVWSPPQEGVQSCCYIRTVFWLLGLPDPDPKTCLTLQEAAEKLPADRTSNLPSEDAAVLGVVKEVRTPSFSMKDWDLKWPLFFPDIRDHFALDIMTDGGPSHTIGFRREPSSNETPWTVFDTNLLPPFQGPTNDTLKAFMLSWLSLYAGQGYLFTSIQGVRYIENSGNLNREQRVWER